ncbi:MAG: transcriptional repressor LexA [Fibrobacteres bacterium]|nr:transcriptional repressor LexA [Fibrobacterota bacterium]MBK9576127.1 transcriptional repressor LexA [Fibrobacterota bacterium]QQS05175.1 MAG: transcriptional repressor LexA [Fibrobacterota bacterium]
MTHRQRQVLEFIRDRVRDTHCPPTVREICEHFDIRSTNGVRVILEALEKKGHLKRSPRLSRGLTVVESEANAQTDLPASTSVRESDDDEEEFLRVPLLGRVAAGQPILAVEEAEETFTIPRTLLPTKNAFALRVQGESMREIGIMDGDIVFAQPQSTAQSGETVVALVGDEATVKDYFPERHRIRLQPRNATMEPIWISSRSPEFRILGKVVGVFRTMR